VLLRMSAQVVQFALQFDDRFLEIELMFHAWGRLTLIPAQFNANSGNAEGRTCVRPSR
jgi:hypothetical protein